MGEALPVLSQEDLFLVGPDAAAYDDYRREQEGAGLSDDAYSEIAPVDEHYGALNQEGGNYAQV